VDCAIDGLLIDRKRDHGGAMSLSKSIENLQMLLEAPLPPDFDPDDLLPSPEYYGGAYSRSVADIQRKIEKNNKKFGVELISVKGSGRVVYRLDVPSSSFSDKSILQKYKVETSRLVPTVIKIATGARGIAQNKAEISNFKKRQSYLYVPMLDNSYDNKKRTIEINDEELNPEESNWVQLLFVNIYKDALAWREAIDKYFGYPVPSHRDADGFPQPESLWFGDIGTLKNALKSGYYDLEAGGNRRKYPFDENQRKNLKEYVALGRSGLDLEDLANSANWGHLNGRPYILDYGLDKSNEGLYGDSMDGFANIDNDGVISLDIRDYR
jgi:hypothetical protein